MRRPFRKRHPFIFWLLVLVLILAVLTLIVLVLAVLLILLMYAGRLGSMTFMILLTRRKPPAPVQYPTDKILVG